MNQKKDIFIEGENIENLFSDDLHPFLKWGMTWLFVVGFALFGMTYFLKWPEVIKVPALLSSSNSPTPVMPKVQAAVTEIYFKNGEEVKEGDVIVELANTANQQDIDQVNSLIDQLDSLYQTNIEAAVTLPISYFELDELGEIQSSYEQFLKAYSDLKFALSDEYLSSKLSLIFSRYRTLNDLGVNLKLQRNTIYKELENEKRRYKGEKMLFDKGSISAYDLQNAESAVHAKRLSFQNIKNSIIQNDRQKQDLLEQKIQLTQGIEGQKNTFVQAYKGLKSTVAQWKYSYVIKSPKDGQISIPYSVQKGSPINPQNPVFFILDKGSLPIVQVKLSQRNINKIDSTKEVRIRLDAYPYEDYGVLTGHILTRSSMPVEGLYDAQVALDSGLKTSFGQNVDFINGLQGEAEIVLDDERLMLRLFRKLYEN